MSFDDAPGQAGRAVAIEVLLEARLKRFQCRACPRDEYAARAIGDEIAAAVGIPDRVLVRTRDLQSNLISPAGELLGGNDRDIAEPAYRDRRAVILELWSGPASDRIEVIVASHLDETGRS